jgi:hypothetical protein
VDDIDIPVTELLGAPPFADETNDHVTPKLDEIYIAELLLEIAV